MTYSEEKKIKISKYCYRMGKACGQRNMSKVNEYLGHLKHHVMTGGAVTNDQVNAKIKQIEDLVTAIQTGVKPIIEKNHKNVDYLQKLQTEITSKDGDLANKSAEITVLNESISAKEKDILNLKEEHTLAISGKENELAKKLEDQITTQKTQIDALIKEKNDFESGVSEMLNLTDKTEINTKFTSIQTALGENKSALQYLTNIKTAIDAKIAETEKLAASGTSNEAAKEEIESLKTMNNSLNSKIAELTLQSSTLTSELDGLKTKYSDLETKHTTIIREGEEFNNKLNGELNKIINLLNETASELGLISKGLTASVEAVEGVKFMNTKADIELALKEAEEAKKEADATEAEAKRLDEVAKKASKKDKAAADREAISGRTKAEEARIKEIEKKAKLAQLSSK